MSVFTKVSHEELLEHLRQYPMGELLGYQGIGEGVENTNYFVDTADGRWVLTLFERTEAAGLPFFLGLMEHLAARGYPCPAPAHALNGKVLTRLHGRPAAFVRRLVGNSVLFATLHQCAAVGTALGELHVLAAGFPMQRVNERGAQWRESAGRALQPLLEAHDAELIADELQAQTQLDLTALPRGVIHADMFRDNVMFVEERLSAVIDFYYACNDALLYDLAITVNDWCAEPEGNINHARAEALIGAYRACREPTPLEAKVWNLVLRAAALRFYLSRLHDWHHPRDGDLVHVKDPAAYRRILEHHRADLSPPLHAHG